MLFFFINVSFNPNPGYGSTAAIFLQSAGHVFVSVVSVCTVFQFFSTGSQFLNTNCFYASVLPKTFLNRNS